jgi:hypothetical protein
MGKAERINDALAGFTDVVELSLTIDPASSKYLLTIKLADQRFRSIVLRCADASALKLNAFGGGLTQFLQLRCLDVSSEQLDRVTLHFSDDDGKAIAFNCADCEVMS